MARQRLLGGALGKLLHAAQLPLCAVDGQSRLIYANPALLTWLDIPEGELLGETHFSSSAQNRAGFLRQALCPPPGAELSPGPVTVPLVLEVALESVTASVTWWPIRHGAGELECLLGMIHRVNQLAGESAGVVSWSDWHARLAWQRGALRLHYRLRDLVGESPAIRVARQQAQLAASCRAPATIVGPVGSGRRSLALAIHAAGLPPEDPPGPDFPGDAGRPLITLDCRLLNAELLAARLGHLPPYQGIKSGPPTTTFKGDASGAWGTLVLLGLQDLPIGLAEASSLMATLERLTHTDSPWRVMATATVGPLELLANQRLSAELAARLSTLVIHLPPLRTRPEDIPWLAQHLVEVENRSRSRSLRGLHAAALERLVLHGWPGDMAELASALRIAAKSAASGEITVADLPPYLVQATEQLRHPREQLAPFDLPDWLAQAERDILRRALAQTRGNKTAAAELVGMNRPRFYRRLVELGLVEENNGPTGDPTPDMQMSGQPGFAHPISVPERGLADPAGNESAALKAAEATARRIARRSKKLPPLPPSTSNAEPEFMEDIPFIPEDE
ncbi:MAG: helix-turn-helix domain-containing protein [Pirellulales bacterium]|nr:helix-turn-helix domain-containing protein [Pirellulales bacterium]